LEQEPVKNLHGETRLTVPSGWLILGQGRTFPQDLYQARRSGLWMLVAAGLTPFTILVSLSIVPSPSMLAIAEAMSESIWTRFRPISFVDCTSQCWVRAYTLISATVLGLTSVIFIGWGTLAMIRWHAACDEALRRGAAPWGLTSKGAIARGPRWWAYIYALLVWTGGVPLLWWLASFILDTAGTAWSGSHRRGLHLPAVHALYWTGLVSTVQLLMSVWLLIGLSLVLHARGVRTTGVDR
jgi:hypothetical protein